MASIRDDPCIVGTRERFWDEVYKWSSNAERNHIKCNALAVESSERDLPTQFRLIRHM